MGVKGRALGTQKVDFNTQDGKHISGTKLHWAFPDDNVEGEAVEAVFLREDIPLPALRPGQGIEVEYNRRGRVIAVAVIGKQLHIGGTQSQ